MAQGSTQLHEDASELPAAIKDQHRAIVSLMEELEAIDWYNQRAEATTDAELADLLRHNRDEEAEHAAMLVEWVRRNYPGFDVQLRRYLFTEVPILEVEAEATAEPPAAHGSICVGAMDQKETL